MGEDVIRGDLEIMGIDYPISSFSPNQTPQRERQQRPTRGLKVCDSPRK
jgi:hypothetical protein